MTSLKLLWQNSKWIALVVVAIGFAVLIWCFRGLLTNPGKDTLPKRDGSLLPPVPKPLQDAVDNAQESALVTKATSKATTDEKKAELKKIVAVKDGKKRRARLAEWVVSA